MKLDYLFAREDFISVFNKTVGNYMEMSHSWSGKIVWNKKSNTKGDENFLINKRLNIIFPAKINTQTIKNMVSEYSYNPNIFMRWVQSIYVLLAISSATRKLLSSKCLYIESIPEDLQNICIIPGNHSIRLVNCVSNECIVIRKKSYRKDKLENLVASRCEYTNIPGPLLCKFDLKNGWYKEERISGISIDRTKNKLAAKKSLNAAQKCMSEIYSLSRQRIPLGDWMKTKSKDLAVGIQNMPSCYSRKERLSILSIYNKLSILIDNLGVNDFDVISAMTHGDFQSGNILIPIGRDTREVYLIDWEYSRRRCQHYDFFVFMLEARFPNGLSNRILSNIESTFKIQETLLRLGIIETDVNKHKLYIYLFLIEEISYRLEDTNVPNLIKPEPGFIALINELNKLFLNFDTKTC